VIYNGPTSITRLHRGNRLYSRDHTYCNTKANCRQIIGQPVYHWSWCKCDQTSRPLVPRPFWTRNLLIIKIKLSERWLIDRVIYYYVPSNFRIFPAQRFHLWSGSWASDCENQTLLVFPSASVDCDQSASPAGKSAKGRKHEFPLSLETVASFK